VIGIRTEEKNRWERRAPLTPVHIARLIRDAGASFAVQSSALRVFPDDEYRVAGARIVEDLGDCRLVLGVKEIPPERIPPGTAVLIFPHVTKGQPGNMVMLRRYLECGATLLDYEQITDTEGRRLVYFGRFAGYAGMIDALWALGQRLESEGHATPFAEVRRAHEYASLDDARTHLMEVGCRLAAEELPRELRPLVFGFTGSGHVFHGAREILHLLPVREVACEDLAALGAGGKAEGGLFEIDFRRHHRFERAEGGSFDPQEFLVHTERYRSAMPRWLPHLTVLIHGAFWKRPQPRLVTIQDLQALWAGGPPRLRVLGDISCDLGGGIEATLHATDPGHPVFVYDVMNGTVQSGVRGSGPVVLAVDNLPCELPRESSEAFSHSLMPLLPYLIHCDWRRPLDELGLPPELEHAIIVHRGRLTPRFSYLQEHLDRPGPAQEST